MTPGQISYEAWCAVHDVNEPYPHPSWDKVPAKARAAWEAVALANQSTSDASVVAQVDATVEKAVDAALKAKK
jgi:hypothetical protein